jgi:hypothetical protein
MILTHFFNDKGGQYGNFYQKEIKHGLATRLP